MKRPGSRMILAPIVAFVLVTIATILLLLAWKTTGSRSLESGTTLGAHDVHDYTLVGVREDGDIRRFSFRLHVTPDAAGDLSLVIYRAEDLKIFGGSAEEPQWQRDGYWNIQSIPLDDSALYDEVSQEFAIEWEVAESMIPSAMFLKPTDSFQSSLSTYESIMLMLMGGFLILLVYCLSLYAFKRSESYLLYFSIYLISTLFSVALRVDLVSFSIIPSFFASVTASFFAGAQMLSVFSMCCRLLGIRLPGKLAYVASWQGVLVGSLAYYLCAGAANIYVTETIRLLLLTACVTPLLIGWSRKTTGAAFLTVSYAFKTGIAIFTVLVNWGLVANWFGFVLLRPLCFLDVPFIPVCMVVVNYYFARKFREAERLAYELGELNATLDKKVETRTRELVEQQERQHNMMLNIFHDLRSPIFTIRGCLELVEDDPQANTDMVGVAKDRATFLSALTEDLFLLSKLETRELAVPFTTVDMSELVGNTARAQSINAQKKGVSLTWETQQGCNVWGNGEYLERMVQNVIANAVYYTPSEKSVHVSLERDGDAIRITVADQGEGISEEAIGHIFEKYYRADKDKTTGLGLAIAKNIADIHRGSISVTSVVGRGSTFEITLPALDES